MMNTVMHGLSPKLSESLFWSVVHEHTVRLQTWFVLCIWAFCTVWLLITGRLGPGEFAIIFVTATGIVGAAGYKSSKDRKTALLAENGPQALPQPPVAPK